MAVDSPGGASPGTAAGDLTWAPGGRLFEIQVRSHVGSSGVDIQVQRDRFRFALGHRP